MAESQSISPSMNILDVKFSIFDTICKNLDLDSKWRDVIGCADNTFFQLNDLEVETCARVLHSSLKASPSSQLLMKWGSMGMRVEQLIVFLDMLRLERCLLFIRSPEPLFIQVQPINCLTVEEGKSMEIYCEAVGFPYPQYNWFREKTRLTVNNQGSFSISHVSLSDAGRYVCRVQHIYDDKWHHVFSSWCNVQVTPSRNGISNSQLYRPVCNPSITMKSEEPSSIINIFKHESDTTKYTPKFSENQSMSFLPQILVQPTSQVNSIGGIAVFKVEARHADSKLCYQWFRNNKPVLGSGGTTNELQVAINGIEDAGSYQVKIYTADNPSQEILSRIVNLEVKPVPNQFTAGDKVALIIGISTYRSYGQPLPAVENDLHHTVRILEKMQFKVVALLDLTLIEMNNAVEMFCTLLSSEVYAIVYCIGHGFIYNNHHYLIPWDACQGTDLRESLCIETVVDKIQKMNPKLLMLLVDVCRKNVEHLNQSPVPQLTDLLSNQRSNPNKIVIYAASIGEQSFEESKKSKHKNPRGLFNRYLLDVFDKQDLTVSAVYTALQENFRSCPYDRKTYPQHPEMMINLMEPERSLWDPIDTIKYEELIKTRTSRWERAHTLPPGVTIQLSNFGTIQVNFQRVASNVMVMVAKPILANGDLQVDVRIPKDEIDQVLHPVTQDRSDDGEIRFQFPNLQRLKRNMVIRLSIDIFRTQRPDDKYQLLTNPIDLGRPMVSCFGLDEPPSARRNAAETERRQPMEHMEESQSIDSKGSN